MGHHIDSEGKFQSDKHPELPPDRIRVKHGDVGFDGEHAGYLNVWNHLSSQWLDVQVGDWVIKGTRAELYPREAEVFAEVYELA